MSEPAPHEVTRLLRKWRQGDDDALAKLMPIVCDELRIMARRYLSHEDRGHTLQPTALVNEVYLRLHGRQKVTWQNRAHFFGFAAQTMRRVLVDHARGNQAQKRGDGIRPLPLDQALMRSTERNVDLVALNDALEDLARIDPRQARIVELKYFVGLKIDEIGKVLEISPVTVKREWKTARLWLFRAISQGTTAKV
jgi:RNA polymerase sigma factor (TIGR02999 family)